MTERRETGRGRTPKKSPPKKRPRPSRKSKRGGAPEKDWSKGERIAKYLARAGVGSRRECEALIEAGKVMVNGERLISPAFKVTGREQIKVGRRIIRAPEPARLWRYHKPAGLITTNSDPDGRRTVHDELPKSLPRVITVGRLDLNTEGLLLLTNDGELARALELPTSGIVRTYRARALGAFTEKKAELLKKGVTADGVKYGSITVTASDMQASANIWLDVSLSEGKKREVRRALEAVGLKVNRLIRTSYGPLLLGELKPGAVEEVPTSELLAEFGELIPEANRPNFTPPSGPSRVGARRKSGRVRKKPPRKK